MNIHICTYKRIKITTPKYIPESWMDRTSLVVQHDDHTLDNLYPEFNRIRLPEGITNLATTRQWLMENSSDFMDNKQLQLDDDMDFSILKDSTRYNTRYIGPKEMEEIVLPRFEKLLDLYPLVGACSRNEAHLNFTGRVKEVGRATRIHGLNTATLPKGLRYDRVLTIEDYDFILQLLRTGVPNAIDCQTFVGDGGSNEDGGCQEIRARTADGEHARLLQQYHPGFVTCVEKVTKTSQGEWRRTDVRVQWKKAFESAFPQLAKADKTSEDLL